MFRRPFSPACVSILTPSFAVCSVHCVFSTAAEDDERVLAGKTEVRGLHISPRLEASLGHGCLHPGVFTATLPGCICGTTH